MLKHVKSEFNLYWGLELNISQNHKDSKLNIRSKSM